MRDVSSGATRLRLRGEINETSELEKIFELDGIVHLDLVDVTSMNSAGIVKWMSASRSRNANLSLILENCPPAVVRLFGSTY